VLELDGKTDIFRAKKILAAHVHPRRRPPAMLTLGRSTGQGLLQRLLDEVGRRVHHGHGLRIPPDAQVRERQGMVDSVKR